MEYRLSAVLSVAVANEDGRTHSKAQTTLTSLHPYYEFITAVIQSHKGRVVDPGERGLLAEFSSTIRAVQCAVAIQRELQTWQTTVAADSRRALSIGVDLGEVCIDDDHLSGQVVHIAICLQQLDGEGGSIYLSGVVHAQLGHQDLGVQYVDRGEHNLDGIAQPVHVYQIPPITKPAASDADHVQDCTILIVDDEPLWHSALTGMLRETGFHVIDAFDHTDVCNALQRATVMPKLAIVDLQLPSSLLQTSYDGLQVLTTLCNHGIYAIVVSAFVHDVAKSLIMRPEVIDVVDKMRFTDESFREFVVNKIQQAMRHADAAQKAEGKMTDQQARLNTPLST